MDVFPNEIPVGGVYHGNCLSTPNDEGVCNVHGSKDYDDFQSSNKESDSNERNGNDGEAFNNNGSGDEVHGALYGQNNEFSKEPQEVPVQEGAGCSIPRQFNENFNHVIAIQCEGVCKNK